MKPRHDLLTHGVYIITAQSNGVLGGLAVAWGMQLSTDKVLICVGKQSVTRPLILESGWFGFHILEKSQIEQAYHFGRKSGRKIDKFENLKYQLGEHGNPLLDVCAARYECQVEEVYDHGTQKLITGKIVFAEQIMQEYEALVYRQDDY